MAFRLIRYAVAAMQRHLEAGPQVIPILFYTEKLSPYPYSTNWLQEFDDPELAGKLYGNAFPLVDVTVIRDRSMAALTLLQKHIRQRRLLAVHSQLRNSSYLVALAAFPLNMEFPSSLGQPAISATLGYSL